MGIELYSVRDILKTDPVGTVKAMAKIGYECVEFYSVYFDWSKDQAREMRKLMDDIGLKCFSTHSSARSLAPENIEKAMDLNQIIGSKVVVMSSAGGKVDGIDGWKRVAERLTQAADKLRSAGMRAGFHNHELEFKPIDGVRPIEVLAKNTPKDVVLQLDVGTCVDAGSDPVKWIKQNAGRIGSIHAKDWAPESGYADKGYRVLFGEGSCPWKKIFQACELVGGTEYYLIEQEGSRFDSLDTAKRCLTSYKRLRDG